MVNCLLQRNLPEREVRKWMGTRGSDILKHRHCPAPRGHGTRKYCLSIYRQTIFLDAVPHKEQNNISVSKYVIDVIFLGLAAFIGVFVYSIYIIYMVFWRL